MAENVHSWSTNQEKFQEWLALPKYSRLPPTQDLFAETLGLSAHTLSRWKQLDGFMEAVTAIARRYLRDDLAEIYNALAAEAKKGSYQHIKLALEVTGEYTEKVIQDNTGEVRVWVFYGDDGTNGQAT